MNGDRKFGWALVALVVGLFVVSLLISSGKIGSSGPEHSGPQERSSSGISGRESDGSTSNNEIQVGSIRNKSKTDRPLRKLSEVEDDLPVDLTKRIRKDFTNPGEQEEVIRSLVELKQINVGRDQLRRGIVFLANGDYEEFKKLRKSFRGDPRDLLVEANRKSGNPDYWFSRPFEEMEQVKK